MPTQTSRASALEAEVAGLSASVRLEEATPCALVIVELTVPTDSVAIEDGYRESTASWAGVRPR